MKLSELAKISSGYLFRRRVDNDPEGDYQVIQIRDISFEDVIDWGSLFRLDLKSPKEEVILRRGDVIFRAKGGNHRALLVDRIPDKTVVTSQFYIIRVKDEKVILPGYLAWYINQIKAQQYIHQMSVGSSIKQIPISSLSDMPIIVLDVPLQERIVQLYHLGLREKWLVGQIQEKRQKLLDAIMLNIINSYED